MLVLSLWGSRGGALEVCPHPECRPGIWGWLEVPVLITGPASIDAFGFELTYDAPKLNLLGYRAGNATRGFAGFEVAETAGRVRIGGFADAPFEVSGTDTLVVLIFETRTNEGSGSVAVTGFVDDLAGAVDCVAAGQWGALVPSPNGFVTVHPEGSAASCCYPTPEGVRLAVAARPAGAVADGILGARFRIEIIPPAASATLVWIPEPGLTASGDPIQNDSRPDSSGVIVTFPECAVPQDGEILLGRILVHGLAGYHEIVVRRDLHASSLRAGCATFEMCGETCRAACMTATDPIGDPVVFRALVNSPSCDVPCGYVAVVPQTWGMVKQLYRDPGSRTGPHH
jgi:hypothetical protein